MRSITASVRGAAWVVSAVKIKMAMKLSLLFLSMISPRVSIWTAGEVESGKLQITSFCQERHLSKFLASDDPMRETQIKSRGFSGACQNVRKLRFR